MTNLEIIGLSKRYPGEKEPVLDHFDLFVKSGEIVSLLGPSGIGKSTLLKIISGIEQSDEGDVRFNGKSILSTPPNKRGAILMFQKAYLFPFLSVEENIGFGLKVQGIDEKTARKDIIRMLELIGLSGFEKRKASQLSGGEQQRVALARALILKPKVLLLDEPLSSLDTQVRSNLQEFIRRIQRELGITSILVTHDLNEAMAMSDRMALLLKGRVRAIGDPMQLYQSPPTKEAAKFVGISTFLNGSIKNGTLETDKGMFSVKTDTNEKKQVSFAIRPENIQVTKKAKPNSIPGKVVDCMYRGEYIEYQVEVEGGDLIRARVPMPAKMIPHQEKVFAAFPAEHLFMVDSNQQS